MAKPTDLENAIDKALTQVRRAIDGGMKASDGGSARPHLEKLERELKTEREHGSVDREWFKRTLRWVVEWAPESDPTLIAALGRIVRVPPTQPA